MLATIPKMEAQPRASGTEGAAGRFSIYSSLVQDSFFISVQLPPNYAKDKGARFPVVYLLDANFHFPMLAASIRQYELAGLLPSLILVGIGYRSFQQMDSLRVRDYLYPKALPSDEINATGGGQRFSRFISGQLIPLIDGKYRTLQVGRTLAGHSFGGYFALYALLDQTQRNQPAFSNFVSASPSLWYNHFYLDRLSDTLKLRKSLDTLNLYLSVGGLEDSAWSIAPVKKLSERIEQANAQGLVFQYKIFSDLGHMDNATITFLKALQIFYKMPE